MAQRGTRQSADYCLSYFGAGTREALQKVAQKEKPALGRSGTGKHGAPGPSQPSEVEAPDAVRHVFSVGLQ